jgi:hypothetical protein
MGNSSSTVDGTFSPNTQDEKRRNRSNSATRRIVKASKPHPSSDTDGSLTILTDTDDNVTSGKHGVTKVIAESPAVARELEQEHTDELRKERLLDMAERLRTKREELLQQRRTNPKPIDDKALLQPNPFSRFLSVFSVEPAHPEHKRVFEGGIEDNLNEPVKKRPRPTDLDETWSSPLTLAVAVAVAAVAVAVFLRLGRKS